MSHHNQKDDHDLIRDFQNGDRSAFVALYKKYGSYTSKSLQYKGVPRIDADDFTQEIWTRTLAALKTFQFQSPFKFFLDRAIRNRFINYIRDKKRGRLTFVDRIFEDQVGSEDEETNLLERIKGVSSDETDQDSLYHELLEVVQKCLQDITNKLMRAALALRLEDLKIRQIAESLEIKFPNANVLVVRGMEQLRDCVTRSYFT